MPPFWWKLLKIMLLLFALFTTIVCINSEMSKRREAEAEAEAEAATIATNSSIDLTPFLSDNLLNIMRNMTQKQPQDEAKKQPQDGAKKQHQAGEVELPAEDIDERVRSIFKVHDGEGVMLFNPTNQQQPPNHQQPEPLSPQLPRPTPRRPISDNKYRPTQPTPAVIDTGDHQCVDGFNQSRSFCTKVNNYPDLSGLKGILSRRFANFFSDEPQPTDVGLRINDDEQYLCNSHVRYLYPKLGQRLDLSWQYIVNTDEFKQGILIEECDHEGESCQFLDSFPNNYVPICKQHYVIRHLATVNNVSSGQPEVANEPFKIPSCCKCVIKSKFSVDSSP
ncbi:protein spaetzle isoform X7 [Drosophila innubila]|uniref:protein spaetzle isoform X7 n=1 Tax=Drosophila innubila TaxID=198719 RepID=UPI00148BF260|nr:protein spaetzle isoform X7 [Drosophila innubila]